MYWVLIMVSLWSPIEGVTVMDFGAYKTHDECSYALHELENQMSSSEGAMCLLVGVDWQYQDSLRGWFEEDAYRPEELQ
jgi:hypothetical protein